jgi:hypothetical protein
MDLDLQFNQYFQPHPLTKPLVIETLRTLWEHGLRFDREHHDYPSWEAQLQSPYFKTLTGDLHAPTLAKAIDSNIASGYLTIELWDQHLELLLSFDPEQKGNSLNPANIGFTIRGNFARTRHVWSTDTPATDISTIPPFLQNWAAFLHWSTILCDITRPQFAVGFNEGYTLLDEYFHSLGQAHISESLRKRRLPSLEKWVLHEGVRYISPPLTTPKLLQSLLEKPFFQVTRLASGGIFIVPPLPPYQYEHGSAFRLARLAREAYDQRTSDPIKETLAYLYYEQARIILQSIGDKENASLMHPSEEVMPNLEDIQKAIADLQNNGQQ